MSMASKATKRAAARNKVPDYLSMKDDGTRWVVVDLEGVPVYISDKGTTKPIADHLSRGLLQSTKVIQI